MKGLGIDETGSIILVLIGVAVAAGIITQIFSGSSINIISVFESNVNQCPDNRDLETIQFQELESRTSNMLSLNCQDQIDNVRVDERISKDRLKRLATELGLNDGDEPLYFTYNSCNSPEGLKGIITNVERKLIAEKGDLLNITWGPEKLKLCVN